MNATICQWFLLCDNPAAGVVVHPVLGFVPTCERCADRLGLSLVRETDNDLTAPVVIG